VQIRYNLSMDDLTQFAHYHYRKTPAARKLFISQLIIWPLLVFGICYLIDTEPDPFRRAFPALIGALVVAAIFPWLYSYSIARQVRKMYGEGPAIGMFGEHTLAIEHDGLRESSEGGEQFAKWRAIYRVGETSTHAFIYLSPVLAHVIPRAKIEHGSLEQFLVEAKKHVRAANA
jgi:hypothetical protein